MTFCLINVLNVPGMLCVLRSCTHTSVRLFTKGLGETLAQEKVRRSSRAAGSGVEGKQIKFCKLNPVHAHILHKRHGKDKTIDSSYRTLSTCPFLANVLDSYIQHLSCQNCENVQAETQFQ